MAKERSQGSVTQGTQNTRAAVAAARDPQFKNNCHSDIPCRSYGYQLATIRLCQHEFSLEESAFRAVSQVSGQCSEQTGQPLNRVWDSRESLASYGQGGGSIGSNPGITSILDTAAFSRSDPERGISFDPRSPNARDRGDPPWRLRRRSLRLCALRVSRTPQGRRRALCPLSVAA